MKIGLLPILTRAAEHPVDAQRTKDGRRDRVRAAARALEPDLREAVLIGFDQVAIAVAGITEAALAVAARRRALLGEPQSDFVPPDVGTNGGTKA
jgi:hypothetical protein